MGLAGGGWGPSLTVCGGNSGPWLGDSVWGWWAQTGRPIRWNPWVLDGMERTNEQEVCEGDSGLQAGMLKESGPERGQREGRSPGSDQRQTVWPGRVKRPFRAPRDEGGF